MEINKGFLISEISDVCLAHNKIYAPTNNEETIAKNTATWLINNSFSKDDAEKLLEVYVKSEDVMANLYKFANKLHGIVGPYKIDKESRIKMQKLMLETKKYMEELN